MKRWAVCALLFLAGCSTYSLEELRRIQPSGNPFQKALAREYRDYASELEREYDWSESWHFADKGLSAAYGKDIGPDNVEDRHIPADRIAALLAAREELLTTLTPATLDAKPDLSAKAFVSFDCWLKNQGDNWQESKIAVCRTDYEDAVNELKQKPPEAKAGMGGPETSAFLVFFEWNKATLGKAGLKVVDQALLAIQGEEKYDIILNGHTDTTGLEKFNLTLSKRRAESVKDALVAGGARAGAIKIFAFGESDPRVPTADNVDEPQNRRVEIFIQ